MVGGTLGNSFEFRPTDLTWGWAINYLEQAHAADSQMLAWLGQDRRFDPLRSETRFVDLLRRIRFDPH